MIYLQRKREILLIKNDKCNVRNKYGIKVGIERKANLLVVIEEEERRQWMSRSAFQEK